MIDPISLCFAHPEIGIALVALLVILVRVLRPAPADASPPEDGAQRRRRALVEATAVVFLAGGIYAWRRHETLDPAPLRRLSSAELPGTLVVPHLDAPIPPGKTVVWCAGFELAWDSFRRDLLGGAPLALGPPAPAETVTALNAAFLPAETVDPASCVVAAGLGPEASAGFIRDVRERFGETVEVPALMENEVGAFAWLAKDLPFVHPFEEYDHGLRFPGSERIVQAFGMNRDSGNARMPDILGQVVVHSATSRTPDSPLASLEPDEFVVELAVRGGEDRLLLGLVPPGRTLRETWEAVRTASAGKGRPAPGDTELAIPRMNFDLEHRFAELEGAPVTAILPPGSRVIAARQRTAFRLDETGARLRVAAYMAAKLSIKPRFVFDQPFLLALVRRDATIPYLLLWVGNDDLLAPE